MARIRHSIGKRSNTRISCQEKPDPRLETRTPALTEKAPRARNRGTHRQSPSVFVVTLLGFWYHAVLMTPDPTAPTPATPKAAETPAPSEGVYPAEPPNVSDHAPSYRLYVTPVVKMQNWPVLYSLLRVTAEERPGFCAQWPVIVPFGTGIQGFLDCANAVAEYARKARPELFWDEVNCRRLTAENIRG